MKTSSLRPLVLLLLAASPVLAEDIKVWPLFYQNTDPEAHSRRTEVLWPLYVRESTPDYVANQFISFPQNYPSQYPNQFYFLWPLSGIRTGDGHDAWLFPVLWSGSAPSGNGHHSALFPAFYYGEEGGSTSLNIALLQHNHWGPNGSEHYLWPLFWRTSEHRDGRSGGSFGVLPLLWMNQRQTVSDSYQAASRCGGVLLLNWWHRHGSTNLTGGLAVSTRTDSSENLFPVFRRASSSQVSDPEGRPGLRPGAPAAQGRPTTWNVQSEDSLWLMPYWQTHETKINTSETLAKSSHTLLPLYHDWTESRDKTLRSGRLVFPLWFHSNSFVRGQKDESADFIVPVGAHLYKRGEYETRNLLGPVFNRTVDLKADTVRYDALFPFFSLTLGSQESAGRVFPLAGWDEKDGERDNLWWLFPFGWRNESQGKIDYARVYPEFNAWHQPERHKFKRNTDCRKGPRRTVAFYPLFWSERQADAQSTGLLPFYWRNTYRHGRAVSYDTTLPLVLGDWQTRLEDGTQTYARQDYLLSLLALGRGQDYRQSRVFPFYSYRRTGGTRAVSSFVLPFSYDSWRDPERPGKAHSSELSIPFEFLPLYRTYARQDAGATTNQGSWFFPFYKRSLVDAAEGQTAKLSILWPLWNGEWQNDETRIRGLGGVVNYYEKDSNNFIEQRLLYRIFTRRTRSWSSEHEVMPLYAQSSREDGKSSWGLLGGLLGGGSDGKRNYMRLFYFKVPTSTATPASAAEMETRERRHATLALNYLRHGRHDRAAIEFVLAEKTFEGDREMQLAAGEAYLKAQADAFGKELRSSVPSSLDSLVGGAGGNLATVRTRLRRSAVGCFENALRLGADKPTTLRKLAEAYVDLDDLAKVLDLLAESDRLQPTFATGMERLNVGETLWQRRFYGGRKDPQAGKEEHKIRMSILAELKTRYPHSPTLALREAGWIGEERVFSAQIWPSACGVSTEAFSPESQQRLALYRQGAEWSPSAEEQAWIDSKPSRTGLQSKFGMWFGPAEDRSRPQMACARHSVTILNAQLAQLLGEKKYDEAAKLQQPLFDLLPRICARCAAPNERSYAAGDLDLTTAMRQLYTLYVDRWKKPEVYLATVEAFAGRVCRHQQAAVEQSIESLRLEQQYIKTWHLSGTIGGTKVEQRYEGGFFERYVDLDKILGRPDRCTITAECVIRSPDQRQAVLRLGFDRTLTAEWNGQKILGPVSHKIAVRDEYAVPVVLKAGENRLRLTVADDTLAYGFFARLSSPSGTLMKDVTVSR